MNSCRVKGHQESQLMLQLIIFAQHMKLMFDSLCTSNVLSNIWNSLSLSWKPSARAPPAGGNRSESAGRSASVKTLRVKVKAADHRETQVKACGGLIHSADLSVLTISLFHLKMIFCCYPPQLMLSQLQICNSSTLISSIDPFII